MAPKDSERICPISFEVARIRLGGGPDTRPSFWKVYREELELNRKTAFRNEHVRICSPLLGEAVARLKQECYFRKGQLVSERPASPSQPALT